MKNQFPPTRTAALARLAAFIPHAGWDYARSRNFDRADATARLSPYIRHRVITEHEVVSAVLAQHDARSAEKFIQEVFWRSYWKGWLELRPSIWQDYRRDLCAAHNRVQTESGLRADFQSACKGQTGIECFDHWAQELADTGYLHNHARMWFASIWIFTLRLPWVLGADLFLRSLLDGDAASNILSWRWVAGVQTRGKNYLATAENIAKFTEGRFNPIGQLVESAEPLQGPDRPAPTPLRPLAPLQPGANTGLLIHDDDVTGAPLDTAQHIATLNATSARSPLQTAAHVDAFATAVLADATMGVPVTPLSSAQQIADWAATHDLTQIALPYAPTGPVRDTLDELVNIAPHLTLAQIRREWDSACWPHATHGFFRFKKQIPALIDRLITP
ncbi:FAD-binding domain-containing protein [Oceaniglobus ichthyenteri]|uniref:FAD-binding domain-containing protein n=1 Tax=Oceaniglobus ichthyenteri TaxID=2136177 RepID=UPI000D363F36|nr:FAD-binding domain-containing protein [Oceaniglobus ichthyenteri]